MKEKKKKVTKFLKAFFGCALTVISFWCMGVPLDLMKNIMNWSQNGRDLKALFERLITG